MSTTPLLKHLMGQQADALDRAPVLNLERVAANSIDKGSPYSLKSLDLATLISGGAQPIPQTGYALIFRRQGSTPGARLNVQIGGEFKDLAPGERIEGRFEGFQVAIGSSSAQKGTAVLVVVTDPNADFVEAQVDYKGRAPAAADLLGDSVAETYVTVPEDTQPSGATPTGSFDASGFSTLRVLIDGQAANTLTTVDLVPWWQNPQTGRWYEQGLETISVPDSVSSGYRYRVALATVKQPGRMYFEVRNLAPAAQTQLGLIVQGIE